MCAHTPGTFNKKYSKKRKTKLTATTKLKPAGGNMSICSFSLSLKPSVPLPQPNQKSPCSNLSWKIWPNQKPSLGC